MPPPFPDPLPPGLPPAVVWAVSRMVPHPLATMTQPLHLEHGETDLPRTFVLCTEGKEDEVEPPYVARVRADPSWRLVELAATHTAHVTAPETLGRALLELAVDQLRVG